MGRLIDADAFAVTLKRISEKQGYSELYMNVDDVLNAVIDDLQGKALCGYENCPTVEAIPKAEVKKFLEEGTKDVGNNVLAIVREDYIHKADYETRLKADLRAILGELQLEIEEMDNPYTTRIVGCAKDGFERGARESQNLIQQKINSLKEELND